MRSSLKRFWDSDTVAVCSTLWGLSGVVMAFTVLVAR